MAIEGKNTVDAERDADKEVWLRVTVDPDLRELIRTQADRWGMTVPTYIRLVLRKAMQNPPELDVTLR